MAAKPWPWGRERRLAVFERAGLGTPGRGGSHHQHRRGGHRKSSPTSASPPIGWRPAASRERTPSCMPPCMRWEWSSVRALGVTIPVGKDSLSMRTQWRDAGGEHSVVAPVSLIVSAFAPVRDARATLTPELNLSQPSRLLLIDLGAGKNRLGGSCWAQVHGRERRRARRPRQPAAAGRAVRGAARIEEPRPAAGLSRPLGRRRAHHGVGNGLRRPLRPGHRFGGGRRSHRRLFCRGIGRGAAGAGGARRRSAGDPGQAWPRRNVPRHRPSPWPEAASRCASMAGRPTRDRGWICAGAGARCRFASRKCATIRIAPARNIRGCRMRTIPACMPR